MSPTNNDKEQARLAQPHQVELFAISINRAMERYPGEDSRKLLLDVAVSYIFALKRYKLASFSDAESVLKRCGFDDKTSEFWGNSICGYANQEG